MYPGGSFGCASVRWAVLVLLVVVACSDRQRRNPLDPLAENPVELTVRLAAVAGDGEVRLSWNYARLRDLDGVRLYRTAAGGSTTVRDLDPESTSVVDVEVQNGTRYRYDLALVVAGEGEQPPRDTQLATPGPEIAWVADAERGYVWQISPDNRTSRFARGRFPALAALALDRSSDTCWVSDRRLAGLHWIAADGEWGFAPAGLERPGALSVSGDGETGWVADDGMGAVYWFMPQTGDSLELVRVDADFHEPVSLAAAGQACWIADRADGRILLYSRDGTRLGEWRQLDGPLAVAAGRTDPPLGWALVGGGQELLRLEPGRGPGRVLLPFATATALSVDPGTGECWVLGQTGVAAYDLEGNQILDLPTLEGGPKLAVEPGGERVWIAVRGAVSKHTRAGEELARLEGFGALVGIAVAAGSP